LRPTTSQIVHLRDVTLAGASQQITANHRKTVSVASATFCSYQATRGRHLAETFMHYWH
jgi:hypothetical protein